MYPEAGNKDKWLVYPLGWVVVAGVLYFILSLLFGLSRGVSLAISIPAGVVGFFVSAMIAENWESGGWDDGGA